MIIVKIYSWPLNKMGWTYTGPLTTNFLFPNKYILKYTNDPQLTESVDIEPYIGKVKVLVTQSCSILGETMNYSLQRSSVHGVLQARIVEWVAIPFSRGIFLTQGLNPGLLHCRQILYHLSHSALGLKYTKWSTVNWICGHRTTYREKVTKVTFRFLIVWDISPHSLHAVQGFIVYLMNGCIK